MIVKFSLFIIITVPSTGYCSDSKCDFVTYSCYIQLRHFLFLPERGEFVPKLAAVSLHLTGGSLVELRVSLHGVQSVTEGECVGVGCRAWFGIGPKCFELDIRAETHMSILGLHNGDLVKSEYGPVQYPKCNECNVFGKYMYKVLCYIEDPGILQTL